MYKGGRLTICDRLTQIKESIYYIQQWYLQPIITQYFTSNKSEIWA